MSYRLRKQTADTQTILQPNTPAYHTSEQTTLQTPDSLCLDPHTTLANTYDNFRVTTYNLRLMTSQLCFTGTHHHQQPTTTSSSLSLSSIARYDLLRLDLRSIDRYDLRLPSWDPPPLTTTSSKCHIDYQRRQPILQPNTHQHHWDSVCWGMLGHHHHQSVSAASQ